jgi:hypothetical protein
MPKHFEVTMTLQKMAQSALDVQTACNLSGVLRSFHEITQSMRNDHGMDTPTCNTHPVSRMFAEQISHLTGAGCGDTETYRKAYDWCVQVAAGHFPILVSTGEETI